MPSSPFDAMSFWGDWHHASPIQSVLRSTDLFHRELFKINRLWRQRRFIGLANEAISIPSLECRRNDTDLSETYKFLNDDYKQKSENVFQTNVNNLRGHSKKLFKPQSNLDHHKYFYTQRVVEPWNKLPEEVVCAQTLSNLRTKYIESRTDR